MAWFQPHCKLVSVVVQLLYEYSVPLKSSVRTSAVPLKLSSYLIEMYKRKESVLWDLVFLCVCSCL